MASRRLAERFKEFLHERYSRLRTLTKYEKILVIAILTYIIVFSSITSIKFYCFRTQTFDFGIFVQISWQTLNGNFMFTQPRAGINHPASFLGVHVSPFLLVVIFLYALVRSPYTLLVVQTAAFGFAAFFIYRIGNKIIGKQKIALLFAIGFLLYPGTLWPNWYDFHLEAFVPLFSAMIFYYYFSNNKFGVIVSMILLLSTFERAVFIVGLFIFYIAVREIYLKKKKQGTKFLSKRIILALVIVAIVSAAYFLLSENLMNSVWPDRGVYQPTKIFGQVTFNDVLLKIAYIALLAAPLAFLSFDSPLELLPTVPYLFLALASNYQPYFVIAWQYPALISAPFFVAAIWGWKHQERKGLWKRLVALTLVCFIFFSPGSPFMSPLSINWGFPTPTLEYQLRHQALSSIEGTASVLAQENIFPNIAERKVAYTLWPNNSAPPDYIVVDVLDSMFYREPGEEPTQNALLRFTEQYDYGVMKVVNGFIILKKDYNGPKEILMPLQTSLVPSQLRKLVVSFEDSFTATHFFIPEWVKVEGDYLVIDRDRSGSVWWGPLITVPPGKYRVEVEYTINENITEPFLNLTSYYWRPASQNATVYAEKTVLGSEATPGQKSIAVMEFEVKDWVPSFEIVGTTYGKTDISVYSVKLEETD